MGRSTQKGRKAEQPNAGADRPARLIARLDGLRTLREVYGRDAAVEIVAEADRRLARLDAPGLSLRRLGDGVYAASAAVADPGALERVAGRLQRTVGARAIDTLAGPAVATLSVGGAFGDGVSGADLVREAAAAADRAAARAPDGRCVADAEHAARMDDVETARRVLRALREDRLAVAYQPVTRADGTGVVAFNECLARILERSGAVVAAGDFMPALERLRLTRPVDRRMLELALAELAAAPTLRLSVNLSAQSLGDPGWIGLLAESEARRPGLAARLIVEITESAVIRDEVRADAFVAEVRRFGCAVALDDFGAGFSAFRHLRRIRPDILKLDGGLVEGVGADPDSRALVEGVMVAARHFEMLTVAERVNAEADARALRALGVDAFQGYAYGRPAIEPDWRVAWDDRAAM